jgi:hypothetical protein
VSREGLCGKELVSKHLSKSEMIPIKKSHGILILEQDFALCYVAISNSPSEVVFASSTALFVPVSGKTACPALNHVCKLLQIVLRFLKISVILINGIAFLLNSAEIV